MLHTWSLAVEEQFYIFFPLLLMALRRFGPNSRTIVLAAIFVGSLLLSIVLTRLKPEFAFFMLPTRAWELMAGALLAVGAVPGVTNRAVREGLALAGIGAIGWAVFTFTADTAFPGAAALFPVLGAAALIHSAPGTAVGRLLSLRPIVFIGLISYSLYLWHWPVIVFAEYVTERRLEGLGTLAAVVVSVLLAIISWRFVERPFRNSQRVPQLRLFAFTGGAAVAVLAVAMVGIAAGGWPQRFTPDVLAYEAASSDVSPRRAECHRLQSDRFDIPPCVFGRAVVPTAMLWGDSHGVELSQALGEIASVQGRALVSNTTSDCQPLIGVPSLGTRCNARNRDVLAYLDAHPTIRTVFVVGFWANPKNLDRPGFAKALESTIAALRSRGREVVLVGAIPMHDWAVPRHLAHLATDRVLSRHEAAVPTEGLQMPRQLAPTFLQLRESGVTVVDPRELLCRGDRCDIYRDDEVLYFDRHHLSMAGARIVARAIAHRVPDLARSQ